MGYWRYYSPAKPKAVENGLKAKSRRGSIGETWWSRRWIALLESFDLGSRLGRGRNYARRGQVVSIDVEKGIVRARVQGTRSKPYQVKIKLFQIGEAGWTAAEAAMASKAVFAAKLLSGEMPQEIEEAFVEAGVSLFPESREELETDCSCPDWSNPCKHIAAVYYLLAERFDTDPFLIFKLRGRTREEILESLKERRAMSPVPAASLNGGSGSEDMSPFAVPVEGSRPAEDTLESYWIAGPGLESLRFCPSPPEVEGAVLRRLGSSPFLVGREDLSSLLSKAYVVAGRAALERAYGEAESGGDEGDGDLI